jgi:hypothetical protein
MHTMQRPHHRRRRRRRSCPRCAWLSLSLLGPLLGLLLGLLPGLAACRPSGTFTYVDLELPVSRARGELRRELEEHGYRLEPHPDPGKQLRASRERKAPIKKRGKTQTYTETIEVALHPQDGGRTSRVELHGDARLHWQPAAATRVRVLEPAWGYSGDRVVWDIHGTLGWRLAPGYGHSLAAAAGARAGLPVLRRGGADAGAERAFRRWSLIASAGLGVGAGLAGSSPIVFQPSLSLTLASSRVIRPVPGRTLTLGGEVSLDLNLVGRIGELQRGAEAQLVLRHTFWGGLYASCGYQLEPRAGATFSVGLFGSTGTTVLIALALAIAAAAGL